MRNKFFKFNENYANVIKHLDDKQAGQYVKAIYPVCPVAPVY